MCVNYRTVRPAGLATWLAEALPELLYPEEVFPGYAAPVIGRSKAGHPSVRVGQFGLVPPWAKDTTIARHTYNARIESVAEKPSFRRAWRNGHRCIVPMESFYEPNWQTGKAIRHAIRRVDGAPLAVAGLWSISPLLASPNPAGLSFTMLTMNADDHALMKTFHRPEDEKRMLIFLARPQWEAWLHAPVNEALGLISQLPADQLMATPDPLPPRQRTSPKLPRGVTS